MVKSKKESYKKSDFNYNNENEDAPPIPKTLAITMIGVFAAITIVLALAPLPNIGFVNLTAVIETIAATAGSTGFLGAFGVTMGSFIYNMYKPSSLFLQAGFLTMASGAFFITMLMYRKALISAMYGLILLGLFFLAPGNIHVPMWALWDKYIAILLVIPAVSLVRKTFCEELNTKYLFPTIFLISFIGLEIDAMMGNLMFGLYGYNILGMTAKAVGDMYIPFAFAAAWERIIVAFISTLVTVPLVIAIDKNPKLRWLIHRE
ncbi:MAG: hypothetical protein KAR87_05365 [Candidatus Aenigmarchaeota archaeon]|nr:hypothetical protein [Candidatus Aenigmarchaeota archaeon]